MVPCFAILGIDCGKVELVVNVQYAPACINKNPLHTL
jgi:hypothetical protein